MNRCVCILLLLGLLLSSEGCKRKIDLPNAGEAAEGDAGGLPAVEGKAAKQRGRAAEGRGKAEAREGDRRFEALLAGKDEDGDRAMEAHEYLAPGQAKNGLWKTSREQTRKWADELYEAGAAKVYAVYMPADKEVGVNMCAALLVELPKPKEQRAKALKAFNRIDKHLWGDDHEKIDDEGQKFLFLNMDP